MQVHASLHACLMAGCHLGSIKLRTWPADILVSSWRIKDTAAFDITVTSPLSPKIVSKVVMLQNHVNIKTMTQCAKVLVGSAFH